MTTGSVVKSFNIDPDPPPARQDAGYGNTKIILHFFRVPLSRVPMFLQLQEQEHAPISNMYRI